MANEKNLIPYKKGESGNPKGRPKGSLNRSTTAKRWLEVEQELKNPLTGVKEKMSQEDLITLALIKKARNGDSLAYQKLMDSAYGKPLETKDITIDRDAPIFGPDDV
jgi:hypothetical protein